MSHYEHEKKMLHIIQHALGRNEYGHLPRHVREEYRNHYVLGPGCNGYEQCTAMVASGLMEVFPGRVLAGGVEIFVVTEAGRKFMLDNSPKPPKLSPGAKRYRAWLDSGYADTQSFGEFIKSGDYKKVMA